jgi:hypothetical protein
VDKHKFEKLDGIKVFKVGDESEKQASVVGKTGGGRWGGCSPSEAVRHLADKVKKVKKGATVKVMGEVGPGSALLLKTIDLEKCSLVE